jgi:SAM-dependent methyltransferase
MRDLLAPHAPFQSALDFGSGDGWFAKRSQEEGLVQDVVPLDVLRRKLVLREPILYDGKRIPFPDASFDLVYAVDALHHCPNPIAAIDEIVRCSRRYVLIKDHTYRSVFAKYLLSALDELGNRRFGVPSLHQYQRDWSWLDHLEGLGFSRRGFVHPAHCDPRPPFRWFSHRFQFVGLWEANAS